MLAAVSYWMLEPALTLLYFRELVHPIKKLNVITAITHFKYLLFYVSICFNRILLHSYLGIETIQF